MILILFFVMVLDIYLSIKMFKKISISFELIFNKLHIDTDIWGSGEDV